MIALDSLKKSLSLYEGSEQKLELFQLCFLSSSSEGKNYLLINSLPKFKEEEKVEISLFLAGKTREAVSVVITSDFVVMCPDFYTWFLSTSGSGPGSVFKPKKAYATKDIQQIVRA